MNMKFVTTNIVFLAVAGVFIFTSCDNVTSFLEAPETIDVTIDDVFSDRTSAESFLWETYRTTVPNGFPFDWSVHTGMYASMLMAASDEGDVFDAWPSSNAHNTGVWGPTDGQMGRENHFGTNWKGVRNANIFLEHIDLVPNITGTEKEEMKAEAKVLRGLVYMEMIRRYGALPIVDEVLAADGEILIPRATYEETVEFIVRDAEEAAAVLPDSYPSSHAGRITRGAALALKGRVLLYAASPLTNTNSPYMPSDNVELIGYGNYDASRWQRAAEANKAVLDWAAQGHASLVTDSPDPQTNYHRAIEDKDTPEMILANQAHGWWGQWDPMFGQFVMPRGVYGGWYGHGVTLNHAQKYWTVTGDDQVWQEEGPYDAFLEKMQQMEPRFQYSVYYSGSAFNDELGVRHFYINRDGVGQNGEPVNGVGFMRKFLANRNPGAQQNWPIFRLAEFYLNYAEALNEVSPSDPDVFWALNVIRDRAGLPHVSEGDPGYSSQDELRKSIWRERAVELAFEEHRFFDVRRWMIAGEEGVMRGDMWGFNIYEQDDGSFIYKKEVFEQRVFQPHMYFYPFPQNEVNKGYLVQNPGW